MNFTQRRTIIVLVGQPDGNIAMDVKGELTAQEVNWALDNLKLLMLRGEAQTQRRPLIPGMLRPDGGRVRPQN